MSKIGGLKAKLIKLQIDPDKLEEVLAERSSLVRENARITSTVEEGKRQSKRLMVQNEALLNRNYKLRIIDQVVNTRLMPMPCKICGSPIYVRLEYDTFYRNMIAQKMFVAVVCPACGINQQFTGWDIIFQIALLIIPRTVSIRI